jgi:hypothetical protein
MKITISLLGDPFFTAYSRLEPRNSAQEATRGWNEGMGLLVRFWAWCEAESDPGYCATALFLDDLGKPGTFALLVKYGFIVETDGVPRFTGPEKDPEWLVESAKGVKTYVIRRGDDGPVKIGRSRNVGSRISELQGGCAERLRLLHTIDGDVEKRLHGELAAFRVGGEWFTGSAEFFAALGESLEKVK